MGSIQSFILKLIDNNIKYISMGNLTITNPFNVLSRREKEVLDLMLQGAQVKDISATLELKSNTISTFKKNILAKTGVKNNIELFKLAQEFNIV